MRLREIAPGIEVKVLAANEFRDVRRREADNAIRHARPEQPELMTKLVRSSSADLYAATCYLDQPDRPQTAANLLGVEPILPDLVSLRLPFWLDTHRELLTSRRIRVVYDHLAEALS